MMSLVARIAALSAPTGPWLATFGREVGWTPHGGSARTIAAVVDGPRAVEDFNEDDERRRLREIDAQFSVESLDGEPINGTITLDGATYVVRDVTARDEGMITVTARERIIVETGKRIED